MRRWQRLGVLTFCITLIGVMRVELFYGHSRLSTHTCTFPTADRLGRPAEPVGHSGDGGKHCCAAGPADRHTVSLGLQPPWVATAHRLSTCHCICLVRTSTAYHYRVGDRAFAMLPQRVLPRRLPESSGNSWGSMYPQDEMYLAASEICNQIASMKSYAEQTYGVSPPPACCVSGRSAHSTFLHSTAQLSLVPGCMHMRVRISCPAQHRVDAPSRHAHSSVASFPPGPPPLPAGPPNHHQHERLPHPPRHRLCLAHVGPRPRPGARAHRVPPHAGGLIRASLATLLCISLRFSDCSPDSLPFCVCALLPCPCPSSAVS